MKSTRRRAIVVCLALSALTVATPAFRPVTLRASGALYNVTDLGALNCCYDWVYASAALAINAHGDVAGFTSSPTDPLRTIPFIYQNGTMTPITDNYGWATSINDAGEVTGFFLLPGQLNVHAFRYEPGRYKLELIGKGSFVVLGVVPQSVELKKRDVKLGVK